MALNTEEEITSLQIPTSLDELLYIKTTERSLYKPTKSEQSARYIRQNLIKNSQSPVDSLDFFCEIEQFKHHSIGLYLYFDFLKRLIFVMFAMSLIAMIAVIFNYSYKGLDKFGQARSNLLVMSLANQPEYTYSANTTSEENSAALKLFAASSSERLLKVAIPDFAYSVLFLVFLIYWRSRSSKLIEQYETRAVTASKFTAQVTFKNTDESPRLIINNDYLFLHFSKLVDHVSAVEVAYHYGGVMYEMKQIGEQVREMKLMKSLINHSENKKQRQNLEQKYEQGLCKLKKTLIERNSLQEIDSRRLKPVRAFVTFGSTKTCHRIIEAYRKAEDEKGCCLCPTPLPERLRYQGQDVLVLKECRLQPSDIKWDNLDVSRIEFFCRWLSMLFLLLLMLFLTFLIIFLVNMFSPTTSKTTNLKYSPTFQDAVKMNSSSITDAFCLSLSLSILYSNSQIWSFCSNSIKTYYLEIFLTQIANLLIVITNYLLSKIIYRLSEFRRFRSKSELAVQIALSETIATVLNTCLITILLQSDIFSFVPSQPAISLLKTTELSSLITTYAIYTDFTKEWYTDVGQKLTYMWLLNIFVPHVLYFALSPLIRVYRRWMASRQPLQIQANQYLLPDSFPLSYYVAFMLYTVIVSLLFSSAMPYFLFCGTAALLGLYITSKYALLRMYSRPPAYSPALNSMIINVLPIALLLHLLIGIYCYSVESIFPSSANSLALSLEKTLSAIGIASNFSSIASSTNSTFSTILTRMTSQLYMVVLFVLLLFGYLFQRVIIDGFRWLQLKLCRPDVSSKVAAINITSEDIFTGRREQRLEEYRLEKSSEYEHVQETLHFVSRVRKTNGLC